MNNKSCYLKTTVGWLRINASERGLTSIDFIDEPPKTISTITNPHLKAAYKQLNEYFRGERMSFTLELAPEGTDFQRGVWNELAAIPFGSTATYGELAKKVGKPGGARAVGMANNRNPLPIVVPCHRVVGASGDLVGYAGGLAIKSKLLALEGIER